MRIIGTPCWCLLSMLAFILYKNMHLSAFQIAVIVALKPATSLLSPYWTQSIFQRPDKIILNLSLANLFRHLPFLFIPWVESSWYIIFSFSLYMMLTRATIPAWIELFKYNLPKSKQEEIVSLGTVIDYLGTAIFAVLAGLFLDSFPDMWRWAFSIAAALGALSTLLLAILPPPASAAPKRSPTPSFELSQSVVRPWKQVFQVLRDHRGFAMFQIGFMLGGAGLMIMQPALPKFFIDILHLSFTEMGIAIALCKGAGVALASSLWTRLFRRISIFQLSALVTLFATLFPFFLLSAKIHLFLLYLAYIFYGIMQAGSELSWHMSGLVFAREKDSSVFSATNVFTVGIRGCLVPAIGSLLLPWIQPLGVILSGAFLCCFASCYFFWSSMAPSKKSWLENP